MPLASHIRVFNSSHNSSHIHSTNYRTVKQATWAHRIPTPTPCSCKLILCACVCCVWQKWEMLANIVAAVILEYPQLRTTHGRKVNYNLNDFDLVEILWYLMILWCLIYFVSISCVSLTCPCHLLSWNVFTFVIICFHGAIVFPQNIAGVLLFTGTVDSFMLLFQCTLLSFSDVYTFLRFHCFTYVYVC